MGRDLSSRGFDFVMSRKASPDATARFHFAISDLLLLRFPFKLLPPRSIGWISNLSNQLIRRK